MLVKSEKPIVSQSNPSVILSETKGFNPFVSKKAKGGTSQ